MVRAINKLTARQAETLTNPGRHSDGGNLYLSISPAGSRRWTFLYRWRGKPREMGLGSAARGGVSLADARKAAQLARESLAAGIDPIAAKEAAKRSALSIPTFGTVADELIDAKRPEWKSTKHVSQWVYSVQTLAAPLRSKPVNLIETRDVLEVLKPLWQTIPETASRLRGRIEAVLDAAKAHGYRQGENPARWRGHLDQLLAKRQRLTRGHYKAMDYRELPSYMTKLRERQSIAALALEFVILTAARTGEAVNARWPEINLEEKVWTVPAARMKAGREHRIPLSDRAIAILKVLAKARTGDFVFGDTPKRGLSSMAMAMLLRRMNHTETVHGFRSSFRDWASETTGFPHEICEMALAHTIENKAESAYRRGDLLAKRRQLMDAWAAYCDPAREGKIIPLAKAKR